MFASRIWSPDEDHCYCSPGFLESLVFVVVFIFFLIVFFCGSLTIFSYVSFIEGVAISNGVLSIRVQWAMHVFNVVMSSGLGKLPWFVSYRYGVVPRFLSWCLLFRWFCLSGLSRLLLSGNLSRVFSCAIIIFSTVRLNSSLFLGFSLQKS